MPSLPPPSRSSAPGPTIPPQGGLSLLADSLKAGGLDLLQPFSVQALLDATPPQAQGALQGLTASLGLVVGNTRALWPAFRSHLAQIGVRSAAELGPDPLDIYVEEVVHSALAELHVGHGVDCQVLFAHDTTGPSPVPIQRICDYSGLARLGPAHLNVHPVFGPWLALRAVILLELPLEFGVAFAWSPPAAHVCADCLAPCRKALANALLHRDAPPPDVRPPPPGLSEQKARWLTVRDVCPVGVEHRYSEDQIRYHYDKDPSALLKRR